MLESMFPYGVSGGPVTNAAGEVIGIISGAYAREDNYETTGWAIQIDYALMDASQIPRLPAANVVWPPLQLITNADIAMRAFAGPQVSLVEQQYCSDNIERIDNAWNTTAHAIAEVEGYLVSARVAADRGARQAKSRQAANELLSGQVGLLKERFGKVRDDFTAYRDQIVSANLACGRDIDAIKDAIGKLPKTDNNKQLAVRVNALGDEISRDVNMKTKEDMQKGEYELQKQWDRIGSVGPLSDNGSFFLSRPSHSIESDIQMFIQYCDAMQFILENGYSGVYKDIYRDLESTLHSYQLWIESTNRQPWDR
jgi:hypothetical protein